MPAGTYDISAEQGATFNLVLTWRNPDASAIDLTGCTAKMQVRTSKAAADAVLTLQTGAGITLGGTAGTLTLSASAAAMAAISAGSYLYDLEVTDAGGSVTRLVEGAFVVSGEVTK